MLETSMRSFASLKRARHSRRNVPILACCLFFLVVVCFTFLGQWSAVRSHQIQGHPDENTRHLNLPGSLVPAEEATIFVSIAAYRDNECLTTLESLFGSAKNPRRVFLGISEERLDEDVSCIDAPQPFRWLGLTRTRTMRWADVVPSAFSETYGVGSETMPMPTIKTPLLHEGRDKEVIKCVLSKDAPDVPNQAGKSPVDGCQVVTRVGLPANARGPTYGRYLSSLFYNNQDYYMVIDSHTRGIPQWDLELILRARAMPTRGVMSHYPNGYRPERPDTELLKEETMLMCKGVLLYNDMPKLGAKWFPNQPKPILQGFVAAGFMFGDAQFVREVPFDPYLPYMFDGEEILYTVRLWTSGWDSYSPGKAFMYHNYNRVQAPRYFSNIRGKAMIARELAEKRALYIMERDKLHTTTRVVSEEEANKHPEIGHDKAHYGLGKERPVRDYWSFVQLSNEFVVKKDNEHRWMGGEGLCESAASA